MVIVYNFLFSSCTRRVRKVSHQ